MKKRAEPVDPEGAFCEVCLKPVGKADAIEGDAKDHVVYFCSNTCYDRWQGERPAAAAPHEVQGTAKFSESRDQRLKETIRRHPQRDEPRVDAVEPDEIPPA